MWLLCNSSYKYFIFVLTMWWSWWQCPNLLSVVASQFQSVFWCFHGWGAHCVNISCLSCINTKLLSYHISFSIVITSMAVRCSSAIFLTVLFLCACQGDATYRYRPRISKYELYFDNSQKMTVPAMHGWYKLIIATN